MDLNWGYPTNSVTSNANNYGMPGAIPAAYAPLSFDASMPAADPTGLTTGSYSSGLMSFGNPVASAPSMAAISTSGMPSMAAAGDAASGGLWGWFGKNSGTLSDLAKIGGGIAQIWGGIQANKLAKDQLNFQKQTWQTNLSNQIKSYNLALADRIQARAAQNERSAGWADAQIAANKL